MRPTTVTSPCTNPLEIAMSSVYSGVFERYGDHSPTAFDHNINIDDDETVRSNWFVMPVSRTRDSGPLDNSNFATFLAGLGGESEQVEVHRFGHWGPGWYEIIIVHPEADCLKPAYDMARSLENYSVLDDEDFSRREWDEFFESWRLWANSDFIRSLQSHYDLSDNASDALFDVDIEELMEVWQQCSNEPFIGECDGITIRFTGYSLDNIGRSEVARLIRLGRSSR
jgi:hypothetical protein